MPLAPLADADWPDALAGLRDSFLARANVYRTMAHDPALLAAWSDLRVHVVQQNALGPELLEVAILRTAHRLGAEYEWAHHVHRARRTGFTDARITALRGPVEAISDTDRPVAEAVDALTAEARLPEELRDRLLESLGKEAVLDLMATVGFYSTLAFVVKSFGTPVEADIAAEPPLSP